MNWSPWNCLSPLVEMLNNNLPFTCGRNIFCQQFQPRKQKNKVFNFRYSWFIEELGDFKHNAIKLRNSQLALPVSLKFTVSRFLSLSFSLSAGSPKCSCQELYPAPHRAMHYSEDLDLFFDVVKLKWQILRQAVHLWHLQSCTQKPFVPGSTVVKLQMYLKLLGTWVWKVKLSQTKPASFEMALKCWLRDVDPDKRAKWWDKTTLSQF